MRDFEIIVAVDSKGGIGKNGNLPWNLPEDLKHFKMLTTKVNDPRKQNAVIMGRKTWESLPEKFRPLPGRLNIVVSGQANYPFPEGVLKVSALADALVKLGKSPWNEEIENVIIIGGGAIFEVALQLPGCLKIHLTRVFRDFRCDVFFR